MCKYYEDFDTKIRYFDHKCIPCGPYASEKFGQIWTKMIEEAMMRLFLRKKTITGRNFDRLKKIQNLLRRTLLLGRIVSFSFPCDMNIIQLPHCSEKEIWKWSPILELFPNYCLLSRQRRMMTWLALLISKRPWSKSRGALCVIFTILVSFSRDNALFASKAKINVVWNFF